MVIAVALAYLGILYFLCGELVRYRSIRVMALASDSTGQRDVGGSSNRDQKQYLYGPHTYVQNSRDESGDNFHLDNASGECFGPFASAPGTSGNVDLICPVRDAETEIREPGGYAQWSQIPIPMQSFDCSLPAGISSFATQCSFPAEQFGQDSNQSYEAYRIQDCQVSDFENDSATGYFRNLNDSMAIPVEYRQLDTGLGDLSAPRPLVSSPDNSNSFQIHVDSCVSFQTEPLLSTRNVSLPNVPSLRRSRRKASTLAIPMHEKSRKHLCDRCSKAFSRAGDLRRHYKVHLPGDPPFHCFIEGCSRSGEKGFYRRDKLRDHQRQAHRFDSTDGLVLLQCVRDAKDE